MNHTVCVLSFEYPPKIAGGLGTFTENLEEGLAELGVDVNVYMPGHGIKDVKSEVVDSFTLKTTRGLEHIEVRARDGLSGRENIVVFSSKNEDSPLNVKEIYRKKKRQKCALFAAAFREYFNRELSDKKVVLHANDHHSGLAATAVKAEHPKTPFLYTIHLVHVSTKGGTGVYKSLLKKYRILNLFDTSILKATQIRTKGLFGNLIGQKAMDLLTGEASYYLEPLITHYADRVNTVSRSYLKYDVNPPFKRFGIPRKKFTYVFNGMHVNEMVLDDLSRKKVVRKSVLSEIGFGDGPLFINIGRQNTAQKATDALAGAIEVILESKKAPDARFVIVAGERKLTPDVKKILHKLERKYPKNVYVFRKWLNDVTKYFIAANAFLMPSRWEPFGLTQIEAMTRGTVVIGSTTGGIRDVQVNHDGRIDEEYDSFKKPTGMLFGLGSANGLATRILDMYDLIKNKPDEYGMLQENAIERAKYFTIERTVKNYLRLYEEIINKTGE